MYRPSKKPRKTWALLECIHSPPVLTVCRPVTTEKLSCNGNRCIRSSTFGARKNGLPNRNVVPNPMAVSAGTDDRVAERGRSSREYVTWSSFNRLAVTVLKRFRFNTLILPGPSVPLAEVPYVATSKVWLVFFESLKLYDAVRVLEGGKGQSSFPSSALF